MFRLEPDSNQSHLQSEISWSNQFYCNWTFLSSQKLIFLRFLVCNSIRIAEIYAFQFVYFITKKKYDIELVVRATHKFSQQGFQKVVQFRSQAFSAHFWAAWEPMGVCG